MLGVEASAVKAPGTHDDREIRGNAVGHSKDLTRIVALPRRVLDVKDPRAAAAWTQHLRLHRTTPCDCVKRWPNGCITDLNAPQGWALEEGMDVGGLLGSLAVGAGKTGIGILLPMAIPDVKVAVLLMPAQIKAQFLVKDYPQWSQHFQVPNLAGGGSFVVGRPVLHVFSYNEISNPKNSDLFKKLGRVDLVMADECQNLADLTTARTIRFMRIWDLYPKAGSVNYSGTLTKKSPKDFAHLSGLALGANSPLPLKQPVVEEWSALLDASPFVAPTGAFYALMGPGESPRAAFSRRLIETQGVIATGENEFGVSLMINERKPGPIPADVAKALAETVEKSERPDGEELIEALQVETTARQLAAGFFYRWKFIHGETPQQVDDWLKARKEFFKELRGELYRPRENYDSPKLVCKAASRWHDGYSVIEYTGHRHGPECFPEVEEAEDGTPLYDDVDAEPVCGQEEQIGTKREFPPHTRRGPLPVFESEFWPAWHAIAKQVKPITVPVWINDYLVKDAAACVLDKNEDPGIAWYEFSEFGRAVALMAKVPYYGGGKAASAEIIEETGKRAIVASIKAHGTGKNLQYAFSRNLVMNPPSDGACWEQLLGRTHRPGQKKDEVNVWLYRHTSRWARAFDTARMRAAYIQQTTRSQQKLVTAGYSFDPELLP